MKYSLLAFGCWLATTCSFSQNWTQQYTDNNTYYGVHFITETDGWICGQNGTIKSTQDGGLNWNGQNSGTIELLNSITFLNDQIGYAAGNSGIIKITNDGGAAWSNPISSSTNQSILDIIITSIDTGYYVDVAGRVGKTTNGGLNWSIQSVSTSQLSGICFINNDNGWVCGGNGKIYHTTNGGNSWSLQNSGVTDYLVKITFVDTLMGWAVGHNGRIIQTMDGGLTWTAQTMPNNQGYTLRDIKFITNTEGYIVGDMGIILHTTNSGSNWLQESNINTSNHFYSLAFPIQGYVWTVGSNNTMQGVVFHTNFTPTTIFSPTLINDQTIFPNPVSNELSIRVEKETRFSIYNSIGELILTFNIDNTEKINLESVDKGIYILKNESNGSTKKIIKQ